MFLLVSVRLVSRAVVHGDNAGSLVGSGHAPAAPLRRHLMSPPPNTSIPGAPQHGAKLVISFPDAFSGDIAHRRTDYWRQAVPRRANIETESGQERIRTFEGVSQQIYSLPRLTAPEPALGFSGAEN